MVSISNNEIISNKVPSYEDVWLDPIEAETFHGRNDCWFQDMDMDGTPEFIVGGNAQGAHGARDFHIYKYLDGQLVEMKDNTEYETHNGIYFLGDDTTLSDGYGGFRCQLFKNSDTGKFVYVYPFVSSVNKETYYNLYEFENTTEDRFSINDLVSIIKRELDNGSFEYSRSILINGAECSVLGDEVYEYYNSYFSNLVPYDTTIKTIPCTSSSSSISGYYDSLTYEEKASILSESLNAWTYNESATTSLPMEDIVKEVWIDSFEEIPDEYVEQHYDFMLNLSTKYWNRSYLSDSSAFKDVFKMIKFDSTYGELANSNSKHIAADALTLNIQQLFADIESSDSTTLATRDIYSFLLSEIVINGYSDTNITNNAKDELLTYLKELETNDSKKNALDIGNNAIDSIESAIGACDSLESLAKVLKVSQKSWKYWYAEKADFELDINEANNNALYIAVIYRALNNINGNLLECFNEMLTTSSVKSNPVLSGVINDFKAAIESEEIEDFIQEKTNNMIKNASEDASRDVAYDMASDLLSEILDKYFENMSGYGTIWTIASVAGNLIQFETNLVDSIEKIDDVKLSIGELYSCNEVHTALYDTIINIKKDEERNYENTYKIHTLFQLYRHTDMLASEYAIKYMELFYNNNISINVLRTGRHIIDGLFDPFAQTYSDNFTSITGYDNMNKAYINISKNLSKYRHDLYTDDYACCEDAYEEQTVLSLSDMLEQIGICCPANVLVYKDGKWIATLTDSGVSVSNEDYRVLFNVIDEVDEDGNTLDTKAKILRLPRNENYEYTIKAVGDGSLTLWSYNLTEEASMLENNYTFEEIPLVNGNEYSVVYIDNVYSLVNHTSGESFKSKVYTDEESTTLDVISDSKNQSSENNIETTTHSNPIDSISSSPNMGDSGVKMFISLMLSSIALMFVSRYKKKNG